MKYWRVQVRQRARVDAKVLSGAIPMPQIQALILLNAGYRKAPRAKPRKMTVLKLHSQATLGHWLSNPATATEHKMTTKPGGYDCDWRLGTRVSMTFLLLVTHSSCILFSVTLAPGPLFLQHMSSSRGRDERSHRVLIGCTISKSHTTSSLA